MENQFLATKEKFHQLNRFNGFNPFDQLDSISQCVKVEKIFSHTDVKLREFKWKNRLMWSASIGKKL